MLGDFRKIHQNEGNGRNSVKSGDLGEKSTSKGLEYTVYSNVLCKGSIPTPKKPENTKIHQFQLNIIHFGEI